MIRLICSLVILLISPSLFAQTTELIILNKQGDSVLFSTIKINGYKFSQTNARLQFDNQNYCKEGFISLQVNHISYKAIDTIVDCAKSNRIVFRLALNSFELNPATVKSKKTIKTVAGNLTLQSKILTEHIGLFGVPDPLKLLQMSPGISIGLEGTNDIYVRGGKSDQTQLIFDNMYILGPNHIFGLLSSVNGNILGELNLYKGPIPSKIGFKASGTIEMFGSNPDSISRIGIDLGLISSSAYYKSRYFNNKFYLNAAARISYPDKIIKLSSEDLVAGFADINFSSGLKVKKGEFKGSAYYSHDAYNLVTSFGSDFNAHNFRWENMNGSISFKSNASSKRDYSTSLCFNTLKSQWSDNDRLNIRDNTQNLIHANFLEKLSNHDSFFFMYGAEFRYEYNQLSQTNVIFHPEYFYNQLSSGIFGEMNKNLGNFNLNMGLRANLYHSFEHNFTSFIPEPRLSLSMKALHGMFHLNFDRQSQSLMDLNNNFVGLPGTFWIGATKRLLPIISNQWSFSFDIEKGNKIDANFSGYFKNFQNSFDFRDGAYLVPFHDPLLQIKNVNTYTFGFESFVNYNWGKRANIRGSYTYSRVINRDPDNIINFGRAYPSFFDRPHNLNVTINNISRNKKFKYGGNIILQSNRSVTIPIAGNIIIVYSDRNAYRLPAYRRLDIFFKYIPKPNKTRWRSEWNFSFYNALNSKNTFAIMYDETKNQFTYLYLFPIIPMASYQLTIR